MRYGVRGHHEFVTKDAWQEVIRNILIPSSLLLCNSQPLLLPFNLQCTVDHIDHFDQKGSGSRSGIKNHDEMAIW
jgi:hypothetical protein